MTRGLHDRVDIFRLCRNTSNRTSRDDIFIPLVPAFSNVPCRIIHGEKVLFSGDVPLSDGDTLLDLNSGLVFEVRGGKRIRGIFRVHHSSYRIRLKSESGRHLAF